MFRRVKLTNPADRPRPIFKAAVVVLSAAAQAVTTLDFDGAEHLPESGPLLVVGNHVSNYDPVVLGSFLAFNGRFPHWLAKKELFEVPFVGWVATQSDQIPVDRRHPDPRQVLGAARDQLAAGRTVVMYPEGTITGDPLHWPMVAHTGAARLALETRAPVVPVGQWGPQEVMGYKEMTFPHVVPRHTMHLRAGAPIVLDDLWGRQDDHEAVRAATERMMSAIDELVAQLRGEPAPDSRYDLRTGERVPKVQS